MADIVFYTNPQSRGRMVRRMLEECGVDYRTELVAYGEAMKSEAYRRVNPMGKVPALVYDGRVVTEAPAIIAFLADACPGANLAPPPAQRQDYYRWFFFMAGPMEAAITNKALGVTIPPEKTGFVGYGSFDTAVATLIDAVGRAEYLTGDRFTAVDVYAGSHIEYGLRFGMLPEDATLRAYVERLAGRPAWQRAAELDNALLAAAT